MPPALASLDRWLTGSALASTRWGGTVSFRLGEWIRAGMAQAHGSILRAGNGLRISYVRDDQVADARRVPAVAFALYPSPVSFVDGPARPSADAAGPAALEGRSWLDPPDWNGSIEEQFRFHCLHSVAAELDEHRRIASPARLERAERIAGRWMGQCLFRERPEAIWDEHIGAMRALALCELWEAVRAAGEGARPFDRLLVASILRHAIKLEPEASYRTDHNHGVTQAYALLACALALGGSGHARAAAELAIGRLHRQMAENVSPEGILREHSPYYHFFVFRQHLYAERLARARGIAFSDAYRARLQAMIDSGAHMIKPDGTLVAAGDGARSSPILVGAGELDGFPPDVADRFRYRRTSGREGRPLSPPRLIAPDGGFAFLGSDPLQAVPPSDAWHLALRLTTFPTTHIHHDALSFELYAEGNDLLTDSGGPYGYGDPIRTEYFLRTRAHNTVTVDDEDQGVGPCRIRRFESVPGLDALDAEHELYRGVRHRRLILFAPPGFVLLVDWLDSEVRHIYKQWFHFAPGLEASREGRAIAATRPGGGPGIRVIPLGPEGSVLELERGTESPRQGWVCTGDLEMAPRWAARYEREGAAARSALLFVPERAGRRRDVRAELEIPAVGALNATVEVDGQARRIVVAPGAPVRMEEAR